MEKGRRIGKETEVNFVNYEQSTPEIEEELAKEDFEPVSQHFKSNDPAR